MRRIAAREGPRPRGDARVAGRASTNVEATVASVALEALGTSIDMGAPLMSAGLDSLAAAAFVTSLSARLSADIAPTELFDHPTLGSIASFLAREVGPASTIEASTGASTPGAATARLPGSSRGNEAAVAARSLQLAGALCSDAEMRHLSARGLVVNTRVPAARWAIPTPGAGPSATYGSFASAA